MRRSLHPSGDLSLVTEKRNLSPLGIEPKRTKELRETAIERVRDATEAVAEALKTASMNDLEMNLDATGRGVAMRIVTSLRCETLDAWEKSCALSPPSNRTEPGATAEAVLPTMLLEAMLVVAGARLTVPQRSVIIHGEKNVLLECLRASRAEARCRATATTRPCRTERRGAQLSNYVCWRAGPTLGPCLLPVDSSLPLSEPAEVRRTPT